MLDFFALRQNMVDNQIRPSDVTDGGLIKAFLTIGREMFVGEADRSFAYSDRDIRISGTTGRDRWMMSPVVLARLIDALEPEPDMSALVVGCGTGYSAALLSQVVGSVLAVEEEPVLAETAERNLAELGIRNVVVVRGGLVQGWEKRAPYDRILVDGALQVLPQALARQLKPGGTLGAIELGDRVSRAVLFERLGHETTKWPQFDAWTTGVLPGFDRAAEFVF